MLNAPDVRRRAGGNVAAAGREAGQMADAALHTVQAAGQELLRKAGAARAPLKQEAAVSVKRAKEKGGEPDLATAPYTASPASTTGSSHEFQAAAAHPLPGRGPTGSSLSIPTS